MLLAMHRPVSNAEPHRWALQDARHQPPVSGAAASWAMAHSGGSLGSPQAQPVTLDSATQSRVRAAFGKLPLYFIENRGQVDPRVAFYLQGSRGGVFFTSDGVTFAFAGSGDPVEPEDPLAAARQRWAMKLDFVDGNRDARPTGQEPTEAVVSYFTGSRSDWKTGLPTYGGVVYRDLWPGIDLVYSGTTSRLKYTFVVQPGADPSWIQLAYRGATDVRLTEHGRLAVSTPLGGFEDDVPYAFQEVGGEQLEVEASFALEATPGPDAYHYGFRLGDYDETRPLILDPVLIAYSGYLGGSADDSGEGIAVDSAGNAYVSGTTWSSQATFPEIVGPDLTFNGVNFDAYVAKLNPSGTALIYCGYIGGTLNDVGNSIAVDNAGNAYVTGYTTSGDFPVIVGPFLTYNALFDTYVAKVNASGTALTYSGYIGGSGSEIGLGIAVDSAGNAYITGSTSSNDLPVTVGPDLSYNGGSTDAYVAKVNATGSALTYCGYIGGLASDSGNAIAVDGGGNAYVAGNTSSNDFPAIVGPSLAPGGGTDAFVTKVDASGTALPYSGYIGGSGTEYGRGIAVDGSGNAYVGGYTNTTEASATPFPLTVGPDLTYNGGLWDAFVAKVNAGGGALDYSGYIGGTGEDYLGDIAVDSAGNAYVTGDTQSDEGSFPVRVGPSLTHNGSSDAFVAKVRAGGTDLDYCGYIGGANQDDGNDIALDGFGGVYIVGTTQSDEASFPVANGPDLTYNGGNDAFVVKLGTGALKLIGFETGDASEIASINDPPSLVQMLYTRPGSGLFNLRQVDAASVLTSGLAPALDTLGFRFSFYKLSNPGGDQPMVHFKNGLSNLWTLRLTTTGALDIQHNESSLVGTFNNTPLSDSTWYTIRLIYDRQAGGVLRVWLDSALEIDLTHPTGGTATDNIEVEGPPGGYHYDDIYLIDTLTPPPLGQIVRLDPNGPGNLTEFSTAVGLPNHWENVDELLFDDTDYNRHAAATDATDLYALEDSPSGIINAVKGMWRVQRGSGPDRRHDYAWRVDGVNGSADFGGLTTSFELREVIWGSPPTGVEWTPARVDGLELGVRHDPSHAQETDISWTAAMVDYQSATTALPLGRHHLRQPQHRRTDGGDHGLDRHSSPVPCPTTSASETC